MSVHNKVINHAQLADALHRAKPTRYKLIKGGGVARYEQWAKTVEIIGAELGKLDPSFEYESWRSYVQLGV